MDASIRGQLASVAAERRLVEIIRVAPFDEEINGFPLAVGRKLLLLQNVNSDLLLPDGFSVVRLPDVEGVRYGGWERLVEQVLREEGRLPEPAAAPVLRLDGWAHLLADLHSREIPVSVDCEAQVDAFFLGPIAHVGRTGVRIDHVDTTGQWAEERWTVGYRDITHVRFGTRYIDVFSRHAKAGA